MHGKTGPKLVVIEYVSKDSNDDKPRLVNTLQTVQELMLKLILVLAVVSTSNDVILGYLCDDDDSIVNSVRDVENGIRCCCLHYLFQTWFTMYCASTARHKRLCCYYLVVIGDVV